MSYESAWVIRGTDIPETRYSQVASVQHRFHSASNLRSRRLVASVIVFEVSGGSKGQPVGRTLLVTPELLASLGGDDICASFCKRIQPDVAGYGSELLYPPAPELTSEGRAEVKKAARELLTRLKDLLVLNWRQKSMARSQLKLTIEDTLDTGLPRAYTPELYNQKCAAVFEHVYKSDPERNAGVYA